MFQNHQNTARLLAASVLVLGALPALADGTATLLRYEITFGGHAPTHTLALAWHPADDGGIATFETRAEEPRLPLYTSNPRRWALLNAAASQDESGADGSGANAGTALMALAIGAGVVAIVAGTAKDFDNLFDDWHFDIKPPQTPAPPAPPAAGG